MTRLIATLLVALCLPAPEAWAQVTRDVAYDSHAVIHINAKLRFTTVIVLPEGEEILDVICGDKDFWVVSGAQNLAYVKPAKPGSSTNLNLVTGAGRIYSFWLTEGATDADLKVYVTENAAAHSGSASTNGSGVGTPRFFSAAAMEAARKTVDEARRDAEAARDLAAKSAVDAEDARRAATESADQRIRAFQSSYPTQLVFPYLFKLNAKPFFVTAIFHDDKFTYIQAHATELPTLYEIKDKKPNLVEFQVENGVYVVPKVLDRGYLIIGKQKLVFGTTWR